MSVTEKIITNLRCLYPGCTNYAKHKCSFFSDHYVCEEHEGTDRVWCQCCEDVRRALASIPGVICFFPGCTNFAEVLCSDNPFHAVCLEHHYQDGGCHICTPLYSDAVPVNTLCMYSGCSNLSISRCPDNPFHLVCLQHMTIVLWRHSAGCKICEFEEDNILSLGMDKYPQFTYPSLIRELFKYFKYRVRFNPPDFFTSGTLNYSVLKNAVRPASIIIPSLNTSHFPDCPTCDGRGKFEHEYCEGKGTFPCDSEGCNNGWLLCSLCEGNGNIESDRVTHTTKRGSARNEVYSYGHRPCPKCNNKGRGDYPGYIPHRRCLGTGYVFCRKCEGRGYFPCRKCGGSGKKLPTTS